MLKSSLDVQTVRSETHPAGLADGEKRGELAQIAAAVLRQKHSGKRIVHCHGVFDLLHLGHIRHLREAKALGDILVVSLSADGFVNKGPHRPAFTAELRAESLAALECVDYVTISHFPTAVEAITAIQPDVYVKGPDYREPQTDVTGGIALEEAAVKRVGGRIYITDDVTFSSSSLLNQHFPSFPPEVLEYIARFKEHYDATDVVTAIDRLCSIEVTVVGEAILDEYIYCDQMGKSAKDPVLAMRYDSAEMFAGGALAVANHLSGFVGSVKLVTMLGSFDTDEAFVRSHLHPNVTCSVLYKRDSPTIRKRRYVERTLRSKHFEIYYINDEPLDAAQEDDLSHLLSASTGRSDAVVVSDFGHGMLTPSVVQSLCARPGFLAVNTQINAANIRYHAISSYDRADYICINEHELRLDARSRQGPLHVLAESLAGRLGCERIMVTRGNAGVSYFEGGHEHLSPSLTANIVDRTGSGDAVLAITSIAAACNVAAPIIAFLANVIGAQKVQIVGNRSAIDRIATLKFINTLLK